MAGAREGENSFPRYCKVFFHAMVLKIGLQRYNQVVLESSEAARESSSEERLLGPGKPAVEKLPLPGRFLGAAISLRNAYLLGGQRLTTSPCSISVRTETKKFLPCPTLKHQKEMFHGK